jgi:dTDP-4-dehydrorhamnose reductase
MRLLVTGSSGLLGLNLALETLGSHDVIGVDRGTLASAPFETIRADLTDPGALGRTLDHSRAEAVIHCAAMADVDACESDPSLARRVNTDLPEMVAAACAPRGLRLVHVSTDAVFDGQKRGSYSETDAPNPTGVYACTKRASETAVLGADPNAIVARVNFYGWSLSGKRSLAEFFVNNLKAGRAIRGFTDVTFCPMLVNHLADILVRMLESGLHGLYHVVGPQAMSKYQFGVAIARRFGLEEGLIAPESVDAAGLTATRSHNLRLSIHKISTDLGRSLPEFSTGLDVLYAQYQQGYPQRIRSYQQEAPHLGTNALP